MNIKDKLSDFDDVEYKFDNSNKNTRSTMVNVNKTVYNKQPISKTAKKPKQPYLPSG